MAVHHHGLSQNEELSIINSSMDRCDPWEINRLMTNGETIQQYACSLAGQAMGNDRLKMGIRLKAVALTIRMGQQNLLRQKIAQDIGSEAVGGRDVLVILPPNGSEYIHPGIEGPEPEPEPVEYEGDTVIDAVAGPADDESASTQQYDAIGDGCGAEWFSTM